MQNQADNQAAPQDVALGTDPFSIFNTKIEDIKSFDEAESTRKNWDEIFYEPDPEKGKNGVYQAIIKLLPNIYAPLEPVMRKIHYKLPQPQNPSRSFTYDSPSSVRGECPVVKKFFEARDSSDARIKAIGANLKRKMTSCVLIQIIRDTNRPELEGQLRLLRFTTGQSIDKLIEAKIKPSSEDIEMGIKREDVFDPFSSRYLILKVTKGDVGRDFDKSVWTEVDQKGGMKIGASVITEKDRDNAEIKKQIVELLKQPNVNIIEHYAYKAPDEAKLAYVNSALRVMFGEELPGGSPAPAAQTAAQTPATPAAQAPAAPATQAPAAQTPATETPVTQPAAQTPAPVETTPAVTPAPAEQSQSDFLAGLGLPQG